MSPGWGSLVGAGTLVGLIFTQGGSPGSDQTTLRLAVIHRLIFTLLVIYPYAPRLPVFPFPTRELSWPGLRSGYRRDLRLWD
jgi:hypothetical protein